MGAVELGIGSTHESKIVTVFGIEPNTRLDVRRVTFPDEAPVVIDSTVVPTMA